MGDNALTKFFRKQAKPTADRPRRKNERPEYILTVVPCMRWLASRGFSMNKIEAKAVWSPGAGRYLSGQTDPGVADAFGSAPDGTGCFIEFKAPGKIRTLKPHQRDWLMNKIGLGCFAVVTDSVRDLEAKWDTFQAMRLEGHHSDWLKTQLPKPPNTRPKSDELAGL